MGGRSGRGGTGEGVWVSRKNSMGAHAQHTTSFMLVHPSMKRMAALARDIGGMRPRRMQRSCCLERGITLRDDVTCACRQF